MWRSYEFKCTKCEKQFDSLEEPDTQTTACKDCGAESQRVPSTFSGYAIKGDNSSSNRPKCAGWMGKGYQS